MNNINRYEEVAVKKFLAVRDELYKETPRNSLLLNLIYKKPWKFYRKNGKKEALRILREEANNIIGGRNE